VLRQLAGGVIMALSASFPAMAEPQPEARCGPRTTVIYNLANRFLEEQVAQGLMEDGSLFELYANPNTGSFTIVITTPDKPQTPCAKAAGVMMTLTPYSEPKKEEKL
jgi:hypothetical protein